MLLSPLSCCRHNSAFSSYTYWSRFIGRRILISFGYFKASQPKIRRLLIQFDRLLMLPQPGTKEIEGKIWCGKNSLVFAYSMHRRYTRLLCQHQIIHHAKAGKESTGAAQTTTIGYFQQKTDDDQMNHSVVQTTFYTNAIFDKIIFGQDDGEKNRNVFASLIFRHTKAHGMEIGFSASDHGTCVWTVNVDVWT